MSDSSSQRRKQRSDTADMRRIHGQRLIQKVLRKALENKVVLDFRLVDFQREKNQGRHHIGGPPIKPLAARVTRIDSSGGPQLVVDKDGVIVLFYAPNYIPKALQEKLLSLLRDAVKTKAPKPDGVGTDKRSTVFSPPQQEEELDTDSEEENQAPLTEDEPVPPKQASNSCVLDKSNLPPCAWYWSPALCGTGSQTTRAPTVNVPLRQALSPKRRSSTKNLLDGMRELNDQLGHLVAMIHPALWSVVCGVRTETERLDNQSSRVLANDWTTPFPNLAVAFNRETALHRDNKGFCNAMDVLVLLGDFVGGDLHFPDLNLRVEWKPGFMCAFDGYTFAHEVMPWQGPQRTCLINYCRASTFTALNVPIVIPPAHLDRVNADLRRKYETTSRAPSPPPRAPPSAPHPPPSTSNDSSSTSRSPTPQITSTNRENRKADRVAAKEQELEESNSSKASGSCKAASKASATSKGKAIKKIKVATRARTRVINSSESSSVAQKVAQKSTSTATNKRKATEVTNEPEEPIEEIQEPPTKKSLIKPIMRPLPPAEPTSPKPESPPAGSSGTISITRLTRLTLALRYQIRALVSGLLHPEKSTHSSRANSVNNARSSYLTTSVCATKLDTLAVAPQSVAHKDVATSDGDGAEQDSSTFTPAHDVVKYWKLRAWIEYRVEVEVAAVMNALPSKPQAQQLRTEGQTMLAEDAKYCFDQTHELDDNIRAIRLQGKKTIEGVREVAARGLCAQDIDRLDDPQPAHVEKSSTRN
ncbi:hypothetical protein FRC07_011776 [Ceratobasidium sp. 392]|nr:hypothetical protein FRC07_011776 [Ceratobasidium sp. 392]